MSLPMVAMEAGYHTVHLRGEICDVKGVKREIVSISKMTASRYEVYKAVLIGKKSKSEITAIHCKDGSFIATHKKNVPYPAQWLDIFPAPKREHIFASLRAQYEQAVKSN